MLTWPAAWTSSCCLMGLLGRSPHWDSGVLTPLGDRAPPGDGAEPPGDSTPPGEPPSDPETVKGEDAPPVVGWWRLPEDEGLLRSQCWGGVRLPDEVGDRQACSGDGDGDKAAGQVAPVGGDSLRVEGTATGLTEEGRRWLGLCWGWRPLAGDLQG